MFKWRANKTPQEVAAHEWGYSPGGNALDNLRREIEAVKQSVFVREQAIDMRQRSLPVITGRGPDHTNYNSLEHHTELVTAHNSVTANATQALNFRPNIDNNLSVVRSFNNPGWDLSTANMRAGNINASAIEISQYDSSLGREITALETFAAGLKAETGRQQQIDGDATAAGRAQHYSAITAPNVSLLRATTIPATELVHSKFFDDISREANIPAFDRAFPRVPNVNAKNAKGINILSFVAKNKFEHGIITLLKSGAFTADTFLFLCQECLDEAVNLFIRLVGHISGYNEIFTGLIDSKAVTRINLSAALPNSDALNKLVLSLKDNQSVEYLDLSNNNMGEAESMQLGELLLHNKHIKHFKLSAVRIKDELGIDCTQNITDSLVTNNVIMIMDLSSSDISYEGGIAIARCLQSNNSMHTLNIANNDIGDIGVAYIVNDLIQNKSLISINISNNKITDFGAEAIACWIESKECSVVKIDMSGNKIGAKGISALKAAILHSSSIIYFAGIEDADGKIADKVSKNLTIFREKLDHLSSMSSQVADVDIFKELFILSHQIISKVINFSKEQEQVLLSQISEICTNLHIENYSSDTYAIELLGKFEKVQDG